MTAESRGRRCWAGDAVSKPVVIAGRSHRTMTITEPTRGERASAAPPACEARLRERTAEIADHMKLPVVPLPA